ncbi:MAG: type II toxin-antitoxin system VapC family toxin [Nitrospinae bacterium]|nr:type II toxin-antitoxin system VapC family toxin [Nitrospinota bacterium]
MAQRVFIDSNIFLNFLLKEEDFYEGSKRLLTRIEKGEIEGITTLINIMEILSVLRKRSRAKDSEIIRDVDTIGEIQNLEIIIPNEIHIAQAFEIQKKAKLLPTDAILISTARDFSSIFVSRDAELKQRASSFISVVKPEEL